MRAVGVTQPDEVYNRGEVSFVAYSWENAAFTTDVTAKGSLNILVVIRLYEGTDAGSVRFLPGVQLRDVRQGAGGAPARDHAALPALVVRGGEGVRPPHAH